MRSVHVTRALGFLVLIALGVWVAWGELRTGVATSGARPRRPVPTFAARRDENPVGFYALVAIPIACLGVAGWKLSKNLRGKGSDDDPA